MTSRNAKRTVLKSKRLNDLNWMNSNLIYYINTHFFFLEGSVLINRSRNPKLKSGLHVHTDLQFTLILTSMTIKKLRKFQDETAPVTHDLILVLV